MGPSCPLFGDEKSFSADRRGWRRGCKQVMDYPQAVLCYVLADVDVRTCHCQSTVLAPLFYGAPFVACTLLLTEANFVQQKSLLSNKSHFCLTKVILSMTKEIWSTTKLLLSDKS